MAERDQVREQAQELLQAIRRLDWDKLRQRDGQSFSELKRLLTDLGVDPSAVPAVTEAEVAEPLLLDAAASASEAFQPAPAEVRQMLQEAGFGEREGWLFNTAATPPMKPLAELPHRYGLPPFDRVIAPDFAPAAGWFGLFIHGTEVFSAHLAEPVDKRHWVVREKAQFHSLDELIDQLSALAVGMPLP